MAEPASSDPLAEYLGMVRPDARDIVRALAMAVDSVEAGFDRKVTYRMLVYTFDARWHAWVVAVGVSQRAVNLRFLFGRQLDDPTGRLRPGSTTAASLDYRTLEEVDADVVRELVRQAVAIHPR